jgi:uncharacterized repeat protein (TIGR03803 family)
MIIHLLRSRTIRIALMAALFIPLVSSCARQTNPSILPFATNSTTSSQSYVDFFNFGESAQGYYGARPTANLTVSNGVLYGTTEYGGVYGVGRTGSLGGTVFSIKKSGKEKVLYSFQGSPDGANPLGSVIVVNGSIYGTTKDGGTYNDGTVFAMSKTGQNERVLHSFGSGSDGASPIAGLLYANGLLYGTTLLGGTDGKGTIFSVNPGNGTEAIVYNFGNLPDGENPYSTLIDVKGSLYGTTGAGGIGAGTVFRVTTSGVETVLYTFGNHPDAQGPAAGVIDFKGKLYGTTTNGGVYYPAGTVFSVTMSGQEQILHNFGNGQDGKIPEAALLTYKGQLYGTTYSGGSTGGGTVFRISPDGSHYGVVHNFGVGVHDGTDPSASLVKLRGALYGTTQGGGISAPSCSYYNACGWGTVFRFSP